MNPFLLSTLTGELRLTRSPIRRHFEERFPYTGGLLQDFAANSGALLVGEGDAHAGTVGTAFDVMTRLRLDPNHEPTDFPRTRMWTQRHQDASAMLLTAVDDSESEQSDRAIWALALLTETYRSMQAFMSSPISPLMFADDPADLPTLLALAPEDGIRQLRGLRGVAERRLISNLEAPFRLSPSFYGSRWLKADADLIAGDMLIDLKVQLGPKRRTDRGPDALKVQHLYQLIAYALLDTEDEHHLTRVGIYSARYGNLTSWGLQDALDRLAGNPVDLEHERKELAWFLQGL